MIEKWRESNEMNEWMKVELSKVSNKMKESEKQWNMLEIQFVLTLSSSFKTHITFCVKQRMGRKRKRREIQ